MKIILSRKGFDSAYGGYPSPILPDGRMLSLPIPVASETLRFADLRLEDGSPVPALMRALGMRRLRPSARCHLDPDLRASMLPRRRGWRPSFGQTGAAQGHLENERVGPGDVFLFFGWFRHVDGPAPFAFRRGADAHFHALFGYLEIGTVLRVGERTRLPAWLADHPHASAARRADPANTIYVAAERLSLDPRLPGAGCLDFHPSNRLTKAGESRSRWNLDRALFGAHRVSYHDSARAWKPAGYFQSAAIGQEFVVEASPGIRDWARDRIVSGAADRLSRP